MSWNITVEGGKTVRLPTKGKYCDRDIVITAEAGSEGGGDELGAWLAGTYSSSVLDTPAIRDYVAYKVTFANDVFLPEATSIGQHAFQYATGGVFIAPKVTKIGTYAFADSKFTRIECPACTTLNGQHAFKAPSSGETLFAVSLPKVTTLAGYDFTGQRALRTVNLNSVTTVYSQAFRYCATLKILDLPSLEAIPGTFNFANTKEDQSRGYPGMKALILRKEAVCTLANINNFQNSDFADGIGFFYVPRALVDSYKTATNWSTYASQFRALEDYTVDGTITGALDESKI